MQSIKTQDFHLQHTLDSGQVFTYNVEGEGYRIIDGAYSFFVQQKGDVLFYEGVDEPFLIHYFRLDEDHSQVIEELQKHKQLKEAVTAYRGLRIIRQDPFQCTMGFLCSQNSNIPRIKKNMQYFVDRFGNGVFPKAGTILSNLTQARLGYREQYIVETNKQVNETFFRSLEGMSYPQAKERLMELPGVGPKVADCILLFSLDHLTSFPVDVWMINVMKELFPSCRKKTPPQIAAFAQRKFGNYAGYAQQYLYHWKRMQN